MSDFRGKLAAFFMGRYARNDALYNALFVFVLVFLFVGAILSLVGTGTSLLGFRIAGSVLYALSLGAMVWSVCRFMSRNIAARQRENAAWLRFWNKLKTPFRKRAPRPADTDTHVFRACPSCRSVLRLPRQAGRHSVRCPRCGKSFRVRIK